MMRRTFVKSAIAGAVIAALVVLLLVQVSPGGPGGQVIYRWDTVKSGDRPAAGAPGPAAFINLNGTGNDSIKESGSTDMTGGITGLSAGEGGSSGLGGADFPGPVDTAVHSPGNDSLVESGASPDLEFTPHQVPPEASVPEFPNAGLPFAILTLLAGAVVLARRRQ